MKINKFKAVTLFVLSTMLYSCGHSGDETIVKNGLMDFNKTLTIGQALDNWEDCGEKSWQVGKTSNGVRFVEFSCVKNQLSEFIDSFKKSCKSNDNCDEYFNEQSFNLQKVKNTFQWTMNQDDTFQLNNTDISYFWGDGKYLIDPTSSSNELENAYRNKISYNPNAEFSHNDLQDLAHKLTNLYSRAKHDGKAQKKPAASEAKVLADRHHDAPETLSPNNLAGKDPFEILEDADYKNNLSNMLGDNYKLFEDGLSVTSEIELKGEYYFGTGCASHACSVHESAFAIHKDTQKIYVAILTDGEKVTYFGASSTEGLPLVLAEWIQERISD